MAGRGVRRSFLAAAGIAVSGLALMPSQAAMSECRAEAAVDLGCEIRAIATHGYPTAAVAGNLFVGSLSYRVAGPTGAVWTECFGDGIGVTCQDERRTGVILPGDPLRVAVAVTGVGHWSFELFH